MSDVLVIDEGTMMHFGEIMYAALKCGAKKIIIYGDHEQMPFIACTTPRAVNDIETPLTKVLHYRATKTFRCPYDA